MKRYEWEKDEMGGCEMGEHGWNGCERVGIRMGGM